MLKDLLTFLIMPFTFTLLMIVAGLAVRSWFKLTFRGNVLILGGLGLLFFFSSMFGSWLLLSPLERQYEPLLNPQDHEVIGTEGEQLSGEPPLSIVVLGAGHRQDDRLPSTAQISSGSLHRLIEGARIHRLLPGSQLILMGGGSRNDTYTSDVMMQILEELGTNTEDVILAPGAVNTELEAALARQILGDGTPLVLVTSARHMPRSMLLFRGQGLNPIAAPTQHKLRRTPDNYYSYLAWNEENLANSHKAVNEYAGILWSWIRRKM